MMKNKLWLFSLHIILILWIVFCLTAWLAKTGAQGIRYFGQSDRITAKAEILILTVDDWLNQHIWSFF